MIDLENLKSQKNLETFYKTTHPILSTTPKKELKQIKPEQD